MTIAIQGENQVRGKDKDAQLTNYLLESTFLSLGKGEDEESAGFDPEVNRFKTKL